MTRFYYWFIFISLAFSPAFSRGQETNPLRKIDEHIPIVTTGGIVFWGDILYNSGWHIQKNVTRSTYRLLDKKSVQRAHGTFDDCKNRLDEILAEEKVPPMSGTMVIILHGFGANSMLTRHMGDWFRERQTHDHVFCMSYPSTRQSIFGHAEMLDRIIKNLPQTVKQIDIIGHSLGSLVARRYLSGPLDEDWRVPEDKMEFRKKFSPDPRIGRLVMMGPPNNGAIIATRLIGNDPVRQFLMGESGNELGTDWKETEKTLGIPCCPFMIIAGGRGNNLGYNLLIPGDNDGTVSTDGTKLEGAEKWMLFNVGHNEMLLTPAVFNAVEKFLLKGE